MKEWVISVTVAAFSTSVISLILPNGKLSKYIKSVFSLIMVFVVLQPIFKLKNVEVDFDKVFNDSEYTFQTDYLDYFNNKKIEIYKENCSEIIKDYCIDVFEIDVIYSISDFSELIVEKVVINLKNSVINSDKDHIDIIVGIKNAISKYLNINSDAVVVYE